MPQNRRDAIVATMPAVAHFWASEFTEQTPLDAYAGIATPALLIRGSHTRATAHAVVDLLASILPNARTVEIDGAGHMAPLTHSRAVNEAVRTHLFHCSVT